jgi:hypothetical protein
LYDKDFRQLSKRCFHIQLGYYNILGVYNGILESADARLTGSGSLEVCGRGLPPSDGAFGLGKHVRPRRRDQ